MTTRKSREKNKTKRMTGILRRTALDVLPEGAVLEERPIRRYRYRYTTGPFSLPQNSGTLDWILLNNDITRQTARITVFQCPVGAVKIPMTPCALVVTIDPGMISHNGNTYPGGYPYEIQVEFNSRLIFPYVSVWPANFGVSIPGTGINSGSFMRLMP